MPSFHNGAVEIAYLDEGEGDPIVLVHGFASSKNVNWVYPTWVSDLKKAGRRVIALDNRGHGDSGKLYDAAQYEIAIMADGRRVNSYNVRLDSVTVGDLTLFSVDATVHEGASTGFALLGMSFLGRTEMRREGANLILTKRY